MIHPIWPAPDNVKALSTVRMWEGGQSISPFGSFNLGDHVGDDLLSVEKNRQFLLGLAEGCEEIRWLKQVHGVECIAAESVANSFSADASFTCENALACSIMTADCLPVLFCDLEGRQVAAAHAGWRGLAQGVLQSTLNTFLLNGIKSDQVIAWLGPAISQSSFEVGVEVKEAFLSFSKDSSQLGSDWADDQCFVPSSAGRFNADLYRLARLQLEHLGVAGVFGQSEKGQEEGDSWCTHSEKNIDGSAKFYSYRRQPKTGRQASLIWKD